MATARRHDAGARLANWLSRFADAWRQMSEALPAERCRCAREYVQLLRAHIAKEDEILFELAATHAAPADHR